MNALQPYLKALGAFLAAVATNAAVQIQQGHWPTDWPDALRWVGSIVLTTWLVYQLPYHGQTPKTAPPGVFKPPPLTAETTQPAPKYTTSAPPEGKHERP